MRTDEQRLGAMADQVIEAMRGFVRRNLAAIVVRLEALEKRAPERGEKGEPGEHGAPGQEGPPGAAGKLGAAGDRGESGDAGEPGQPGQPGAEGKQGLQGTTGDRGEPGPPGDKGGPGERGIDGKAGPVGERGEKGERGEPGGDGRDGRDGKDGREGKDGTPGRDALELDILPAIEPGKAYPRGTWAQWQGGVIRAVRSTDALAEGDRLDAAGWAVMLRGVADVQVVPIGERGFEHVFSFTGGAVERKAFASPVALYRGVWREGRCERGDTVTYGGHTWHCNEATSDKPAPGHPSWQISVKAGREGRSAYDIARSTGFAGTEVQWLESLKGPKGDAGSPGRDLTQRGPDGSKW